MVILRSESTFKHIYFKATIFYSMPFFILDFSWIQNSFNSCLNYLTEINFIDTHHNDEINVVNWAV